MSASSAAIRPRSARKWTMSPPTLKAGPSATMSTARADRSCSRAVTAASSSVTHNGSMALRPSARIIRSRATPPATARANRCSDIDGSGHADLLHEPVEVVGGPQPRRPVTPEVEDLDALEAEGPARAGDAGWVEHPGERAPAPPPESGPGLVVGEHGRKGALPGDVRVGPEHVGEVVAGPVRADHPPAGVARRRTLEHEIVRDEGPDHVGILGTPGLEPPVVPGDGHVAVEEGALRTHRTCR